MADYVWAIPETVNLELGAGKVERYVRASEAAKVQEHLVLEGHQAGAKIFSLTHKVNKLEHDIEIICSLRDQRIEELNGIANKHAREAGLKDAAMANAMLRIKDLEATMAANESGWKAIPGPNKLRCSPRTVNLTDRSGTSWQFGDPANVLLTF